MPISSLPCAFHPDAGRGGGTGGCRRLAGAAVAGLLCVVIVLSAVPASGANPLDLCRATVGKVAGSFAKLRARQIFRCAQDQSCDSARDAASLEAIRERSRQQLTAACATLTGASLGMGDTCPDASGVCAPSLVTTKGLVECMVCLVGGALDPVLKRFNGADAAVAESCGGCSATPCTDGAFCEPPPGHCTEATSAGVCVDPPAACAEVAQPVCGCDGNTWDNDCERRRALVGLAHEGPCQASCGATNGDTCPAGTFCDSAPGTCGDGACAAVPETCPDYSMPVCGCDGQTFDNDCARRQAGVGLQHIGACHEFCGSDAAGDASCSDTTRFCELPPGICGGLSVAGKCIERPTDCTAGDQAPVCGCDGETYPSDCERMRAGAAKLHDGRCQSYCLDSSECGAGEICEMMPGWCGTTIPGPLPTPVPSGPNPWPSGGTWSTPGPSGPNPWPSGGTWSTPGPNPWPTPIFFPARRSASTMPPIMTSGYCVPMPESCPADFHDPVCGCDGQTHANDCERQRAGASLQHYGACFTDCASDPTQCDAGEFCMVAYGCGAAGGPSICAPIPTECPQGEFRPVCGCDDQTYETSCEAALAGVSVAFAGPCPSDPIDPTEPGPGGEECGTYVCAPGMKCIKPPGHCDAPATSGMCMPSSDLVCTMIYDPVCGCDGQTYGSFCETMQNGTAVDHWGACWGEGSPTGAVTDPPEPHF